MMKDRPHILVIGAGSIGKVHARNVARLGHLSIVDQDLTLAKNLAEQTNAQHFGDDLVMALDAKPHGAIVAVPAKYHASVATEVIRASIPVLVEKPLSSSLKEAEDLVALASAQGTPLFVVSNMRFHPAIQTLLTQLHSIGTPLFARAHYGNYLPNMRPGVDYRSLYVANADEGGVVLDGIHELDYLSWLLGPITAIAGDVGYISDLEIEAEDYAALVFRHESGVRSELHLDFLRPHKRRGCEIVGSEAILDWQSDGKDPEICRVRRLTGQGVDVLFESDSVDFDAPHRILVEHFIRAINGGGHDLQHGIEGVHLLRHAMQVRGVQ